MVWKLTSGIWRRSKRKQSSARNPSFSKIALLSPPQLWSGTVRGLTKRLADIELEITAFGEFCAHLKSLLTSQESKLEVLEKERDWTFKMACEIYPIAAQSERANLHMDSHLKDFVTAIRRQLDLIPIISI
ncbi:hypothetical protein NL676_025574 [Syzygium grande]|nr:hypothetical protein NL676_025574 [Syzygium grande]